MFQDKSGKIHVEAGDISSATEMMIEQGVRAAQLMPHMRARIEAQARAGHAISIEVLKRLDAAPPVGPEVEAMQKLVSMFSK